MTKTITMAMLILLLAVNLMAEGNLYLVTVENSQDVGGLIELEAQVVHYGADGLVVLIDSDRTD